MYVSYNDKLKYLDFKKKLNNLCVYIYFFFFLEFVGLNKLSFFLVFLF